MTDAHDSAQTVADLGERALIERIRARVPPPPDWVRLGIGDDAAVLVPARNAFDVVTTDALVEGVHFERAFVPARAIGHRALAANLSDLAAMGARPRAALLSLALPDRLPIRDFDEILDGLLALASRHETALVGGNIARSPGPLVVDITALGSAQQRRIMPRGGARPGDVVYVSGEIGAAAAGLEWCRAHAGSDAEPAPATVARFLYPDPRVRLGWVLARNRAATACVDLSDGLADGVHQLAEASGVGVILDGDAVPIAPGVVDWFERSGRDPLLAAITGGEDYELLFAARARRRRLIETVGRQVARRRRGGTEANGAATGRLPLTRVGVITAERRVVLRRNGGDEALPRGFTHFR